MIKATARSIPVLAAVAAALAWGCGGDTVSPEAPGCMVEPGSANLGRVLSFPGDPEGVLDLALTLKSVVIINSTAGTSDLKGEIEVSFDPPLEHPPQVVLLPEGRDPHFTLPARTQEIFRFKIHYDASVSSGVHHGLVRFGPPCAAVPFTLEVTAAREARPEFVDEWGGEGAGVGRFETPSAIALGGGNVYVADLDNNRLQRLDGSGTATHVWDTWDEDDIDEGLTHCDHPTGVAVGPDGNVYVADTEPIPEHGGRKRITVFDPDGEYLRHWGPIRNGGSILTDPWHLTVTPDGRIYSVDSGARAIRVFVLDDTPAGFHTEAEWGGLAVFAVPHGIAVDGQGRVFVSDQTQNLIHRFDAEGHETLSWGGAGDEIGKFHSPLGITVDAAGAVYVADSKNRRIQKFTGDGEFITAWGEPGVDPGFLDKPCDVAVDDGTGIIYVLDQARNKILRFRPADASS